MIKLDDKKIAWIIREKKKGVLSNKVIASVQHVTARRVKQIWRHYKRTGKLPVLGRPGRPAEPLGQEVVGVILKEFRTNPVGARAMKEVLKRKGINVSHHKIHEVMRGHGMAVPNKRKQGRRKWVRYERDFVLELVHTDWTQLDSGKWLIAYLDDASRLILDHGVFSNATTTNALRVLKRIIREYGLPDAILTDHGTQFYANAQEQKKQGITKFQEYLASRGIKHIVGRVNHPQTNGKIERFYGTLKQKTKYFPTIHELIKWYNERKPHLSLNFKKAETPHEAFTRKLGPRALYYTTRQGWWP